MSMTKLHRALALSFVIALNSLPVFSQETAPAEAPAAEDTSTAEGLNMGTDAAVVAAPITKETAEVGQSYTAATFDSWDQNCVKTADGADPCQMYQLLKDKDGNSVAELSMFPLPKGGKAVAGATIVVPLETLLTANLLLAIDGSQPKIYPYTYCSTPGCAARIGFTAEELAAFKKGASASITIVPAAQPDQKVVLQVSLKGFTAALDAVGASLPK